MFIHPLDGDDDQDAKSMTAGASKTDADGDMVVVRRPRKGVVEIGTLGCQKNDFYTQPYYAQFILTIFFIVLLYNFVIFLQLNRALNLSIHLPLQISSLSATEHHNSTDLTLVGLQVWRGALLLADYILHNRRSFRGQHVMELGAGVGLTGIAAGMYANRCVCTDINLGGILELIASNIRRNQRRRNGPIASRPLDAMNVMELDFRQHAGGWSPALLAAIQRTDVFLAADVIYDNELTDALIATIDRLLGEPSPRPEGGGRTIYIALEKRYVFTVADMESLAPCYEYFLAGIERLRLERRWRFESVPIDFPQYFEYERVKELVLLRLSAELDG